MIGRYPGRPDEAVAASMTVAVAGLIRLAALMAANHQWRAAFSAEVVIGVVVGRALRAGSHWIA
jgi:hypothetical protein